MDLHLTGRRALVTGGSGGIGKAIARQLLWEGCDVALLARGSERLDATVRELSGHGKGNVVAVVGDTEDDGSVREAVDRAVGLLGGLDILVNCAAAPGGAAPVRTVAELSGPRFASAMNDKVFGYARCAQACAPRFVEQRWGRIINIAGQAARTTGSPLTSMRNAAVVALTKTLADELGPHGVGVFVVNPGATRTERTAQLVLDRARRAGVEPDEIEARLARGSALGRMVTAREVADVVTFLASERSMAMHGDVVGAGGGLPGTIHY
ncbi:SDR family NAD(P)-dependent oxidoreductase [Pseudofrankia saprophytica]|uniref:SDR family NAD(P)-dependent oxidoreductase n=1 Tax=Pseudofrankia saprophytica TaxID=298655 RepID=UPI000234B1C5|nr:SDR family oxidoreductase [Pseudofrankia saprophytica]